jgi:hypothetical protein
MSLLELGHRFCDIQMGIKLGPEIKVCPPIDRKSRNQIKDVTFLQDPDNILPK